MGNPVVWFEINGRDPARLHDFYRKVFGWTIEADNPMSYGFVQTGSEEGIQGAIATGQGSRGVTIFLGTDNVQAALDRAVAAGAEVVAPVGGIPGVVQVAQFRDPEGNCIGLSHDLRTSNTDWMERVKGFGGEG